MKVKQTMFFAVFDDMEQILRDIEAQINIHYYKAGLLDAENIQAYNSILFSQNFGVALSGDWNRIDRYIVLKETVPVNIRKVLQKMGGEKFAVDQMINPKSVELKLGGIYKGNKNVIVAGRVATVSEDSDSCELYKLFSTKIKGTFRRIGMFYVGQKAEEKLKMGWRLVTNDKAPSQYDLALN